MPSGKQILILLLCIFLATPAYAYIDPGSGHIIWQIVVSFLAGLTLSGRRVWTWARALRKPRPRPQPTEAVSNSRDRLAK